MRTFPFGLPKVLISTMASGMTKPFVGTKDIVMLNSICDVAGLNTVTRRVFENGALALAGMAHGYKPSVASGKPLVAMSTLSTTDRCCNRVRAALEQTGIGGDGLPLPGDRRTWPWTRPFGSRTSPSSSTSR